MNQSEKEFKYSSPRVKTLACALSVGLAFSFSVEAKIESNKIDSYTIEIPQVQMIHIPEKKAVSATISAVRKKVRTELVISDSDTPVLLDLEYGKAPKGIRFSPTPVEMDSGLVEKDLLVAVLEGKEVVSLATQEKRAPIQLVKPVVTQKPNVLNSQSDSSTAKTGLAALADFAPKESSPIMTRAEALRPEPQKISSSELKALLASVVEPKSDADVAVQVKPIDLTNTDLSATKKEVVTQSESPAPIPIPPVEEQKETQQAPALFSGRIVEAFTSGTKPIAGVKIKILGQNDWVETDEDGKFYLDIQIKGVLPIVISKSAGGYLPRQAVLKPHHSVELELVPESAVAISYAAATISKKADTAFVFGEVSSTKGEIAGINVDVRDHLGTVVNTAKLLYLDESGAVSQSLQMTSNRGQFMILNLDPGTYFITLTDAFGTELAPHIVHVNKDEGLVRKFSTGEQKMIHGQLLSAEEAKKAAPIPNVEMHLLGNSKHSVSGNDGVFVIGPVYVDCEEPNYLQILEKQIDEGSSAQLYRTRIDYACGASTASLQEDHRKIYIFSAESIDRFARDLRINLEPSRALTIGHASLKFPVKMQLWGAEELEPKEALRGHDVYFDDNGALNTYREHTSKNGNFLIANAPAGLSYIQAFNKKGKTISVWPILLSPSTVNVYIQ